MEKRKPELLAPAGNYESFLGAIAAGADAVYLAGTKYGARAYADNFTEEEICEAVSYAHIFGRKVYLTVNTLLKDEELKRLPAYITPYYQAGLDGVIVQDLGALLTIKEHFPGLALHASTQMSLTGSAGAGMLKELGVVRVVPARELSLKEIMNIKEETGLEIEAFIHGAMCYSYSGQCLFSSILGGRSGNRGRCAQPCRLPYTVRKGAGEGPQQYPLSLKDMCTIECLPALIEAGIDSFKIEGRMKKPEYAAGVTAIYRKYLDLYEQKGKEGYEVSREDKTRLSSLYIRSGMQEGYYFKRNGKDMITLDSPSYNGSDEKLLLDIREQYLEKMLKKTVKLKADITVGKRAALTLEAADSEGGLRRVTIEGMPVETAEKQPISEENIKNALLKLGNTPFTATAEDLTLSVEGNVFYSLKALNELRREGVRALIKAFDKYDRMLPVSNEADAPGINEAYTAHGTDKPAAENSSMIEENNAFRMNPRILVSSMEQLRAVREAGLRPDILYVEAELARTKEQIKEIKNAYNNASAYFSKIYLALPYVVRSADMESLQTLFSAIQEADGCLVRNLETYAWLKKMAYKKEIALDAGLYCFNKTTLDFWQDRADSICLPYELNGNELMRLTADALLKREGAALEQAVYGRLPLMITANCIARTAEGCQKNADIKTVYILKDRYKKEFPVIADCRYCYNVIYNSLPLSLHEKISRGGMSYCMRFNFTTEDYTETVQVLRFFKEIQQGGQIKPPYQEYTKGHEKRGVE